MHKVPPQVSWYICETNVPSDNVQVMSEVTFAHDVYLNVTLTLGCKGPLPRPMKLINLYYVE